MRSLSVQCLCNNPLSGSVRGGPWRGTGTFIVLIVQNAKSCFSYLSVFWTLLTAAFVTQEILKCSYHQEEFQILSYYEGLNLRYSVKDTMAQRMKLSKGFKVLIIIVNSVLANPFFFLLSGLEPTPSSCLTSLRLDKSLLFFSIKFYQYILLKILDFYVFF